MLADESWRGVDGADLEGECRYGREAEYLLGEEGGLGVSIWDKVKDCLFADRRDGEAGVEVE